MSDDTCFLRMSLEGWQFSDGRIDDQAFTISLPVICRCRDMKTCTFIISLQGFLTTIYLPLPQICTGTCFSPSHRPYGCKPEKNPWGNKSTIIFSWYDHYEIWPGRCPARNIHQMVRCVWKITDCEKRALFLSVVCW